MSRLRLDVDRAAQAPALERAAATDPENAFLTPPFAEAQRRMGWEIALLTLRDDDRVHSCCLAGTKRGRLHTMVEIFSLPRGGDRPEFAEGLSGLCRAVGADLLVVDSLGSSVRGLPPLVGLVSRRSRCEHIWRLAASDLSSDLSANHRRNVTRARKAGVAAGEAAGDTGLSHHMRLTDASLARREQRGEQVEAGGRESTWAALLDTGAAALHQARLGEEVLSSILVLKARDGAYYHSAGTSAEGMRLGASQLLVLEVATRLASEGRSVFNLGGAEPASEGLYRFKTGFGTSARELEAGTYQVAGIVRRGMLWLADSARAALSRS
jgi:hypothetical protein